MYENIKYKGEDTVGPQSSDCEDKLPAILRGTNGHNPVRLSKIYNKFSNQKPLKCTDCFDFWSGKGLF